MPNPCRVPMYVRLIFIVEKFLTIQINYPKILSQLIIKLGYLTLSTSVIYCPMSPPSLPDKP